MSSETILQFIEAGKTYPPQRTPLAQLWNQLRGRKGAVQGGFHALRPLSLQVDKGQSLGIVGLNGAGKSTLLQLAAGTLTPSTGQIISRGRVAALLELGSGFNPEATGLENIYLYAATMGMGRTQVQERLDAIIAFSGLSDAINMPVKTYSSGMQVRLAFSVATSVDPDILIVDEALSVGDGVFAKRSFDRVMQLREQGTALLLCSHALFHVDLFCERTLWLEKGDLRDSGPTGIILQRYQEYLDTESNSPTQPVPTTSPDTTGSPPEGSAAPSPIEVVSEPLEGLVSAQHPELVRLRMAEVALDGVIGQDLQGISGQSELTVDIFLQVSQHEPHPRAAVVISSDSGKIIGSTISDPGAIQTTDAKGHASVRFLLPRLPLNKGRYRVGVYLLCHNGRYVYEWTDPFAHITLSAHGSHQGPWLMPGEWLAAPDHISFLAEKTGNHRARNGDMREGL
jgi:lipopolysaccharide transport system ATP-binding protein